MTEPVIRVLRGDPTAEELAALVVALRSRQAAAEPERPPESGWARREDLLRKPLYPGPGAWRASAR